VGRVFSEATGDAADRIDLLTIATHEIGHALGLDLAYRGFQTQIISGLLVKVTPPRPFAASSSPWTLRALTFNHSATRP